MAVLTSEQIGRIWHELSNIITSSQSMGLDKNDLIATINAINSWLDTNAVSLNNAFPAKAKASLSVSQKAALLEIICRIRFGG